MASYLISYDLVAPGRDYTDLYRKIKAYGTWAHVLESVWVVKSEKSSKEIRDNLKGAMDSNDKLLVAKLTGEAAWANLGDEVADWLKKNL